MTWSRWLMGGGVTVLLLACATVAVVLSGCASAIARKVVTPPQRYTTGIGYLDADLHEDPAVKTFAVSVQAGINLRAVVVDPVDQPCQKQTRQLILSPTSFIEMSSQRRPAGARPVPPIATVVALHPAQGNADSMDEILMGLADAGVRGITLDLRGHGCADGTFLTYGARESEDVLTALRDLQARHLLVRPVVLMGASLGGATALMTAARAAGTDVEPDLVFAVAPFARLEDIAINFTSLAPWYVRWLASEGLAHDVVREMGVQAGFDPRADSPLAFAPRITCPVILVHGDPDSLVPFDQSQKLLAAMTAAPEVTLHRVDWGQDHIPFCASPYNVVPRLLNHLVTHHGLPARPALPPPRLTAYLPEATSLPAWIADGVPPVGQSGIQVTTPLAPGRSEVLSRGRWTPPPAGARMILSWPTVPLPWAGQDLDLDLGSIPGGLIVFWDGLLLHQGHHRGPVAPWNRRVRVPGWLATPGQHRLALRVQAGEGVGLTIPAMGWGVMRPAAARP